MIFSPALRRSILLTTLGLSLFACAPEQAQEQPSGQPSAQAEASKPADAKAPDAGHQATGGRVSFLDGDAVLITDKGRVPLKQDMLVVPGQGVHTGSKTRLELSFADGSRLRISPAAEVRFAHQTADQHSLFEVSRGEVWGNVRPGKRKLVFQAKHSTATVLGTVYNINVNDSLTCTRVFAGKVGVRMPMQGKAEDMLGQAPDRLTDEKAASTLKPVGKGDIVLADQWLELAKNQCIITRDKGKAHVMQISLDQLAKEQEWLAWNRDRDKALPPH